MGDEQREYLLKAQLSREAYEGWQWLADQQGTTITAFIETIGLDAARLMRGEREPRGEDQGYLRQFGEEARRISAERRKRR